LSLVRKDEKVGELRIWLGKQFETVGAEIDKKPSYCWEGQPFVAIFRT